MRRLLLSSILLVLAPVCCAIYIGAPQPPFNRTVEASAEALASFDEEWHTVVAGPPGDFAMTFSEAELTSAVWDAISQAEIESGEDIPISNLQVYLEDGLMHLYGTIDAGPVQSGGVVVVQPTVGADGQVDIAISSADFGLIELSQTDLNSLETEVEDALNSWIVSSGANVTAITVANGQLIINGSTGP